jgi:hypothetical protein
LIRQLTRAFLDRGVDCEVHILAVGAAEEILVPFDVDRDLGKERVLALAVAQHDLDQLDRIEEAGQLGDLLLGVCQDGVGDHKTVSSNYVDSHHSSFQSPIITAHDSGPAWCCGRWALGSF